MTVLPADHSPAPRIGLACAGGAFEGAMYEIGALAALEEAVEGLDLTKLDVYVGVSAGGLVVASLANGISPRELSRALVGRAQDRRLNIDPSEAYRPAFREYAQRATRLPQVLAEAVKTFLQDWTHPSLLAPWTKAGALLPNGFFDNSPMERHLREVFSSGGRTNDFRKLGATVRLVAVNLDTADVVCFGDEATAHVPISRAVQASTALPVLYCPVEVDGHLYIDGVARRTVHASVALEHDAGLLFCVNPIVPVINEVDDDLLRRSLAAHGLPTVLSQTFRLLVYSRMLTGFRHYAHAYPDADVVLIEPKPEDSERIFSNLFSFSNRTHVCEHAYQATRDYLRGQADAIAPVLARHGLRLRQDVLDDDTRILFPEAPDDGVDPPRTSTFRSTDHTLRRLDRTLDRLERRLT